MPFDQKTLQAAAAAYRDALEQVGDRFAALGLSDEATAFAIGLGVAAGWANGYKQRRQLRRAALDQVAVAVFDRSEAARGIATLPAEREPAYYARYAGELRAAAEAAADAASRRALLRCADDFERIAGSRTSVRNSVARLYPLH